MGKATNAQLIPKNECMYTQLQYSLPPKGRKWTTRQKSKFLLYSLVNHCLVMFNFHSLFPVSLFSFTYPKPCSKRTRPMTFPRTVELSSLWFPRSSFWQVGAIFACLCCGFSVLSGILKRYQAAFSASSDAAYLALCTCMGLELPSDPWPALHPLLVFSSLNTSWA